MFVVERGGNVRIVKNGVLQPISFLVVQNVDTSGERGLLSIAFPPNYASSGLVYAFAAVAGQLRVIEYHVTSNRDIADSADGRVVLAQSLGSATNHNGGQLAFGPDGYLYVSMGENATSSNAQTATNDLGKILRIDPRQSGANQFTIPPGNPVDGAVGAKPEIWARGLRNPYRA